MDGRHFKRLHLIEIREKTGKARGEHRLARAWRSDHQEAVAAGGSDFKCTLSVRLPLHFRKVGISPGMFCYRTYMPC